MSQNLFQQVRDAQAIRDRLLAQIQQTIKELPDNPKITRISANAFVIQRSALDFVDLKGRHRNNWSVETHDFKRQYELIANALRDSKAADPETTLNMIIQHECVHSKLDNESAKRHQLLHPDVVRQLIKLRDQLNGVG